MMKSQTFNDGVVSIYSVGNIAESGNMPRKGLTLKIGCLRYEERTVGMGRFWAAAQTQVKIDRIIRTPRILNISTQDVVVLPDGKQYEVKQVQYPPEVIPLSMDLSLERLEVAYEFDQVT